MRMNEYLRWLMGTPNYFEAYRNYVSLLESVNVVTSMRFRPSFNVDTCMHWPTTTYVLK
jgi:hypothetical protein